MRPKEVFRYVKEAFTPYHLPELPKPPTGKLSRAEQAQYQRDFRAAREVKDEFSHRRFAILKWGGVAIGAGVAAPIVVPAVVDAWQRMGTTSAEPTPTSAIKAELTSKPVELFKGSQYENWQRYPDGILPRDQVVAIANDLINAKDYPGFPEAGQLLVKAITAPRLLTQINPPATEFLRVGFANLNQQQGNLAMLQFNMEVEGVIEADITDKTTGIASKALWDNPKSNRIDIFLDREVAYAPVAVKIYLIAKEISHLAYLAELKSLIFKEFTARFDLRSPSSLPQPDLLYVNSALPFTDDIPMGLFFRNRFVLLDWAGYWHVTPTLGKMMHQGVLSDKDKFFLGGNVNAFNLAKERGLLVEQSPGNYVWQEGIGPYSQEWQDVMKSTKDVPSLRQT